MSSPSAPTSTLSAPVNTINTPADLSFADSDFNLDFANFFENEYPRLQGQLLNYPFPPMYMPPNDDEKM